MIFNLSRTVTAIIGIERYFIMLVITCRSTPANWWLLNKIY